MNQKEPNIAFIYAATIGDLKAVKRLHKQGADIHAYNDSGLNIAAHNGNIEVVKYLVEQGANVQKDVVLYSAFIMCRLEVIEYLLKQGADLSAVIDLRKTMERNICLVRRKIKNFVSKEDIQLAYIRAQSKQLNAG